MKASMAKLREERKRTDLLLYQLLPKTVADQLRKGESAVSSCEVLMKVNYMIYSLFYLAFRFGDAIVHRCSRLYEHLQRDAAD
jgi:hypothetical protein